MNAFEDLAQAKQHKPLRQWAKVERPPMVKQGLEKKQAEQSEQLKRYRQWKREVREGLTRGDYGMEIVGLFKLLRQPATMDSDQYQDAWLRFVRSAKWMRACSTDTRETLLGYIDEAIIRCRIRNGWPPFDDDISFPFASVAQLVEHRLTNEMDAGSSPVWSARKFASPLHEIKYLLGVV